MALFNKKNTIIDHSNQYYHLLLQYTILIFGASSPLIECFKLALLFSNCNQLLANNKEFEHRLDSYSIKTFFVMEKKAFIIYKELKYTDFKHYFL